MEGAGRVSNMPFTSPTTPERNSHRFEVALADSTDLHGASAVVGVVLTRKLRGHIPLAAEGHHVDQRCGADSRKGLKAIEQLLLQGFGALLGTADFARIGHAHPEDVVGVEAEPFLMQAVEALR